jgi:hypothetical protein
MLRKATLAVKDSLKGRKDSVLRRDTKFGSQISSRNSRIKDTSPMIVEEPALRQIEKKLKIVFTGRFKNVCLWVPQDCLIRNSRVFSFSLMTQVNFRRDQH